MGAYSRVFRLPAALVVVLSLACTTAKADDEPQYGWREVWSGADISGHVWLLYSGATVSPFGNLYEDGLRLRIAGGYGRYSYLGERRGEFVAFNAETSFSEALVGYLKRLGPLTAKGFVGVATIEHDVAPLDPDNSVQGRAIGPKLAAEFWLNLGQSGWSSLDASWTSAHGTAAARWRGGYRVFEDTSLGLEGALNANDFGEDARIGAFSRCAWDAGELSVAVGFAGRFLDGAQSLRDPYMTINWLTQF